MEPRDEESCNAVLPPFDQPFRECEAAPVVWVLGAEDVDEVTRVASVVAAVAAVLTLLGLAIQLWKARHSVKVTVTPSAQTKINVHVENVGGAQTQITGFGIRTYGLRWHRDYTVEYQHSQAFSPMQSLAPYHGADFLLDTLYLYVRRRGQVQAMTSMLPQAKVSVAVYAGGRRFVSKRFKMELR
jgi:hypothetical protein